MSIIAFAFIGLLSGFLSGLLGIGGGTITVPLLFFVFQAMHFPIQDVMPMAIATSLSAMITTLFFSSRYHLRSKSIMIGYIKPMIPAIIIGTFIGAISTNFIPSELLETFFGVFLFLLALKVLIIKPNTPNGYSLLGPMGTFWFALGVSTISTLLGIAGGVLLMPYFQSRNIKTSVAVGTSCAIGFMISLLSTIFFIFFSKPLPQGTISLGFIYLPAFIFISIFSFFSTKWGSILSHQLKDANAKKIFSLYLIVVSILMIIK